jgi:hypothetical protein
VSSFSAPPPDMHPSVLRYTFVYLKTLNMGMNMREFSIGINILNISKHCPRICGDFIFTVVCRVLQCQQAPLRQPWFSRKKNLTILENKNLGGNPPKECD